MSAEVVFQDKEVTEFLKKVLNKSSEIQKKSNAYVGLLSAIVFSDIMNHFEKEAGPDGPWQDWSDAYSRSMAKRGRASNKLLQYSGKLRQTFLPSSYRKLSDGILWYNNAKTKSGAPYAWYHDEGGTVPGRPPQREFMWLSDRAMEKMEEQTLNFMSDE